MMRVCLQCATYHATPEASRGVVRWSHVNRAAYVPLPRLSVPRVRRGRKERGA